MTLRIAFLCSGGGGNLRFIAQAIELGLLGDVRLCAVLSDRECLANQFARERGVATQVLSFGPEQQSIVISALVRTSTDIVVTNVHRILGQALVNTFSGRLVNLHYSLLPAYGGMIGIRPVEAALADGMQFIGTTAHDVTHKVDAGRPIVQALIPTEPKDSVDAVMDIVFRTGCLTLLGAMATLTLPSSPREAIRVVTIHGRDVTFNPPLPFATNAFDDAFWQALATYPVTTTTPSPLS